MSVSESHPSPRLRIALVGWGAIGQRLATLLRERERHDIVIVAVAVRDTESDRKDIPRSASVIASPDQLEGIECDLVVEAAGRDSVEPWAEFALSRGLDFVISSTSALCADAVRDRLIGLARENRCQIIVTPGAVGGIDALAAAAVLHLDDVEHLIIKPPAAWIGTPAEAQIDLGNIDQATKFFSGSARQAADAFPKNANVAAISALAGVGLDETRVTMVVDPEASFNGHRIIASGQFGTLEVKIQNKPLATNPKSSELTALSLVRLIENRIAPLVC